MVQSPGYSPADVGNAERFCDLWGEVTRYDVGRGCWMLWSGTHWEPDAKGDARNRMVKVAKHILNVDVEVHRLASRHPDDWDAIQHRKLKKGRAAAAHRRCIGGRTQTCQLPPGLGYLKQPVRPEPDGVQLPVWRD